MACPGGCAGGGGQPIEDGKELAGERGKVLYGLDKISELRFSHENPSITKCYEDFLGNHYPIVPIDCFIQIKEIGNFIFGPLSTDFVLEVFDRRKV